MGSIGPAEILIVLVVALIVLGPDRLPAAARSMGKAVAELRRVTSGMQAEVRDAFAEAPTYPTPPSARVPADAAATPAQPADQPETVVLREPDPPKSA